MQAFLIPSFISVTAMLKYCMGFVFFWGCFFFLVPTEVLWHPL